MWLLASNSILSNFCIKKLKKVEKKMNYFFDELSVKHSKVKIYADNDNFRNNKIYKHKSSKQCQN